MSGEGPGGSGSANTPASPIEPQGIDQRARVALLLVGAVGLSALASLWADLSQVSLLDRVIAGERTTLAEAQASDSRVATTALITLVLYVLSAITFLLWYSRAYRNVLALGAGAPRWKPRWAVAYWFIPIVSLFRPKQVVNDIWRGSDPELAPGDGHWHSRRVAPLIHWWWALWLLAVFGGNFAGRPSFETGQTAEELRDEAIGYAVVDVFDFAAAVTCLLVIRTVSRRQGERLARHRAGELEQLEPPSPPPTGPRVPGGGWECLACGELLPDPVAGREHVRRLHSERFSDPDGGLRAHPPG